MESCERVPVWTVVKVPYPHTDRPTRQHRPALVVANTGLEAGLPLVWALMITSAENRGWTGDVEISDITEAGLPAASVVRTEKIASIDARDIAPLGRLPERDRAAVREKIRALLAGLLRPEH